MEALAYLLTIALGVQGVLAAVFVYLFVKERDRHLAWWAAAWSLGALVLGIWLLMHTVELPKALNAVPALGAVIEQVLLVAGAYAFLGRRLPRAWLVAALVCIAATAIGRALGLHPGIAYQPVSAFTIALTVTAGVTTLRGRPSAGRRVIGWGILLWGLHLMLYPLTVGQLGELSAAITVATIMRLGIAAGILVVHFDRSLANTAAREAQLRMLFEGTSEGLFRVSGDGRFLSVNPSLAAMLGYTDLDTLMRRTIREVVARPAGDLPWHEAAVPGGVEMTWRRSDDQSVTVMVHGRSTLSDTGELEHFDGFVCNITEERRLRTQLEQSQRMEAIGRVTGGIAHDFNNLLTVILANTAMLEDDGAENRDLLLRQARDAAHRAADLTQHLLAFSRRQALEPDVVDLGHRVHAAVELTKPLIGETIAVELDLADEPIWVRADAIQLEQIVLNLALNARDAMPAGGQLTVRARRATRSADNLVQHPNAQPGEYALLTVTDSGTGIAASVLPHIFEPFFTTKAPGSGTGLGLSTVYGIVTQSHGHIEVDSTPGDGTTFRVYLPEVDAPDGRSSIPVEAIVGGDGEMVLVAEDEELLREVFRRILEQRGYRVVTARNGADATRLAAEHDGSIDLLITDVAMPGISGVELARRLRQNSPGLPVIFVSGYTERNDQPHTDIPEGAAFLSKPFSAEELLAKARAVLGDSASKRDGDSVV